MTKDEFFKGCKEIPVSSFYETLWRMLTRQGISPEQVLSSAKFEYYSAQYDKVLNAMDAISKQQGNCDLHTTSGMAQYFRLQDEYDRLSKEERRLNKLMEKSVGIGRR